MKKKLLTVSVCMLWAPLFVFAGQNTSGSSSSQSEQEHQQQINKTVTQCKQAQQALNDATNMLQSASSSSSGTSQSNVQDIQKTVQQAKSHLDSCTTNLETIQQSTGGQGSSGGGSQGQ